MRMMRTTARMTRTKAVAVKSSRTALKRMMGNWQGHMSVRPAIPSRSVRNENTLAFGAYFICLLFVYTCLSGIFCLCLIGREARSEREWKRGAEGRA